MIPIKLETIFAGRTVESDRVEYKSGWNPNDIMQTICAFANDFHNYDGGYIVIGVEEDNGRPILPPKGIKDELLDYIQKELFQFCNYIKPRYIPVMDIVKIEKSNVLFLWCPGGQEGPYDLPCDVYGNKGHREYFIKAFSVKTVAKGGELSELFAKFNSIPFDEQTNKNADISDMRKSYIEDYLNRTGSSLVERVDDESVEELSAQLKVASGPRERMYPKNIGLLMFADKPEEFFYDARIDLVWFKSIEAEASDEFIEKRFTGPIYKQVYDVLEYLETNVLVEKVYKNPTKIESDRYFNYPSEALKEAVVNAVFHKSYKIAVPVEVRIYVDCIKIINHPGPDLYIDMDEFKKGKAINRRYRNQRIGSFFKELHLSEAQSTGINKIIKELRLNGSPEPEFDTNEKRDYLITTLKIHEGFQEKETSTKKSDRSLTEVLTEKEIKRYAPILDYMQGHKKITNKIGRELTGKSESSVKRYLNRLTEVGILKSVGSTSDTEYIKEE